MLFQLFKRKKAYEELKPSEFEQQIAENSPAIVLDVRTAAEFREGHLPGAVNLNFMDTAFAEKVGQLDKSKPYYVYCRSGGRSGKACSILVSKGCSQVSNLAGGLIGWTGKRTT